MKQINHLIFILFYSFTSILWNKAEAAVSCSPSDFKCFNGQCIKHEKFCDKSDDCGDNSDEQYCTIKVYQYDVYPCPSNWVHCPTKSKCIPPNFVCDGTIDCQDKSEEFKCGPNLLKLPGVFNANKELKNWLLQRRNSNSLTDKWGLQLHRIAVALHLADESTFEPGKSIGDEIRYELTIQLLNQLKKDKKMNSQELALYIHALLVTCMDPRDFYGSDLVRELRESVEATKNYTNPFQILVLCNTGDTMTGTDADRAFRAFSSQLRPSWGDVQALATMALACIDHNFKFHYVENTRALGYLMKTRENGGVGDLRTTALVTQAAFIKDLNNREDREKYHLNETIQTIIEGLSKKSIVHAYYVLPVLNSKNLLHVNADHCKREPITEEEGLKKVLDVEGETIDVQYSVWIGDKENVGQIWKLRLLVNSTIYDAIGNIAEIDNRQNVTYSFVNGKPYVTAVNKIEDDPEVGKYWSVYLRSSNSDAQPQVIKESPMDVKLEPNQEIILWYKSSSWDK